MAKGGHIVLIDFKDIEEEGMLKDIEKRLNERRGDIW